MTPPHELLQEAIQRAVNETEDYEPEETGLVTRWIVIAEVAEQGGERSLWTTVSVGLKTWESQGMLHDVLVRDSHRGLEELDET